MDILPAIDIKDGRVVRLYQGDYGQVTTFPDSVLEVGRRWQDAGARWLHVVDLDGARAGRPVNTALILALRRALTLQIEVGGGLRTAADIGRLLDAGVERVILGTAALEDPDLLDGVLARDPAALGVALDARDGLVATAGWLESSGRRAETVARTLAARGVRLFSHTDIACDGALGGPNYAALRAVQAALRTSPNPPAPFPGREGGATLPSPSQEEGATLPSPLRGGAGGEVRLIAAGGVASLEHVRALREMGIAGAIIGRALYTGAVALPDALRVAAEAAGISAQEEASDATLG